MTTPLLIVFPGRLLKSLVWERPDVLLFDLSGWWSIDGTSSVRRLIRPGSVKPHIPIGFDVHRTMLDIKEWSPIWARWIAQADQYELLYREALGFILQAMEMLTSLHVRAALFLTSAPHHLDSSLLQLACAEAGVPQVFLYYDVIDGRLLPLLQTKSIEDRSPLNLVISDYSAHEAVARFRANAEAGQRPVLNAELTPINRAYQSPLFGILDVGYMAVRPLVARFLRGLVGGKSDSDPFFDQFKPLGVLDLVRLIRTQKTGLAYHDQHVKQGSLHHLLPADEPRVPVIAAHYQPEASSFPDGGRLHNHYDIVVSLRALGYTGPIVYKEHVGSYLYYTPFVHQTRVGMNRSKAYYARLRELGCIFMDPKERVGIDSETNQKAIPVTIAGTIAVERSLVGLKTIVTGKPWYGALPGTTHLSSMKSLHDIDTLDRDAQVSQLSMELLCRTLSEKTLLNAPGIGTGKPLNDAHSVRVFTSEVSRLVEQLLTVRLGDAAS